MAMLAYRATYKNGQIQIEGEPDLDEGDELIVTVVKSQKNSEVHGTVQQIRESGMIGMWADRDDIGDSEKFADDLRRRAERRHRDDN